MSETSLPDATHLNLNNTVSTEIPNLLAISFTLNDSEFKTN